MKKTYKIDVDCANCANKMEEDANKVEGVEKAIVNLMTLKQTVSFAAHADPKEVMPRVLAACKRVESDCEIFL